MIGETEMPADPICISPEKVTFLDVRPGMKTKKTICVTNTGVEAVRIGLKLQHSTGAFIFNPTDIRTLKTGEFIAFDITFMPTEIKLYLDYLEIEIDRCRIIRVNVQAYPTIDPDIPAVTTFGNTHLNTLTKKSFTVRNTSQLDFIYLVQTSAVFDDMCNFRLCPNGCVSLPANSTVMFTVSFRPTAMATKTIYATFTPLWNQLPGPTRTMTISGNCNTFGYRKRLMELKRDLAENDHGVQFRLAAEPNETRLTNPCKIWQKKGRVEELTNYKKKIQAAKTVLRRRRSWQASYEKQQQRKKENRLLRHMGFEHSYEMPVNQRKVILRKMLAAVDEALFNPDEVAKTKLLQWMKKNLQLDPVIIHKLRDNPAVPYVLDHDPPDEPGKVKPQILLPPEPIIDFVVSFVEAAEQSNLTINSIIQLFPELAPILTAVEKLITESKTPPQPLLEVISSEHQPKSKQNAPRSDANRLSPSSVNENKSKSGRGPSANRTKD